MSTRPEFIHIEPSERHVLPHPKMAWHYAEIRLGHCDGRWFYAISYQLDSGQGGGGPLGYWTDAVRKRDADTRDDAMRLAIADLRNRLRRPGREPQPVKHLQWADDLERQFDQGDLFAGETA